MNTQEDKPIPTHIELAILDSSGDTKLIWDASNPDEVELARDNFKALKKKGYAIFRVKDKDGEKGELMHEFEAKEGRMIAIKQLVGG